MSAFKLSIEPAGDAICKGCGRRDPATEVILIRTTDVERGSSDRLIICRSCVREVDLMSKRPPSSREVVN